MRVLFKLLQNVQFWLFWQDFKISHRSAMIDISKSFILMMDTYSQIYIKSNFQDPTFCWFWAGKCQKLLIFKADDFASKIAKNAFWRSFCSWKTPISWLVTIKWPLQTPMLVVVLMMINPNFFWCWNQQFWRFVNGFTLKVISLTCLFYPQTWLFGLGSISVIFRIRHILNIFSLHQPEIEVYQIFFEKSIVHLKLRVGHICILDNILVGSGRNLGLKSKKAIKVLV